MCSKRIGSWVQTNFEGFPVETLAAPTIGLGVRAEGPTKLFRRNRYRSATGPESR